MPYIEKKELASNLINGRYIHYTDHYSFQRPYPFCNENVSGYLDFLDLEGKSLLTVGSSADQAISAVSRGCTDITILDICPFTEEYFYLKKAAIETLDKQEFEKLLFYKDYPRTFRYNKKPFEVQSNPRMISYLKKESPSSHEFWLTLTKTHSGEMIRKNLFTGDEENPKVTRYLTDYLKSEKDYYETRRKLKNINPFFITENITHGLHLDRKFDNIVLSNLTTYLSHEQIEDLLQKLIPHLEENGRIILGYMYRTDEFSAYYKEWDDIYNIERIKSIDPNIELKTFRGVKGVLFDDDRMKDAVYVYQKKK